MNEEELKNLWQADRTAPTIDFAALQETLDTGKTSCAEKSELTSGRSSSRRRRPRHRLVLSEVVFPVLVLGRCRRLVYLGSSEILPAGKRTRGL
jgi:hypothetical protein